MHTSTAPFEAPPPPPSWTVNPANYQFSMNVVARINYNGAATNAANNLLGVFVGNELRGVASPTISGGNAYYFVSVYANQYNGETLRFRVYYGATDQIHGTPETVVFQHNLLVGSIASPYFVNATSAAITAVNNGPAMFHFCAFRG